MMYKLFFYRPHRPHVLYPTVNAGSTKDNPVVYVNETIIKSTLVESNHICDGDIVGKE